MEREDERVGGGELTGGRGTRRVGGYIADNHWEEGPRWLSESAAGDNRDH